MQSVAASWVRSFAADQLMACNALLAGLECLIDSPAWWSLQADLFSLIHLLANKLQQHWCIACFIARWKSLPCVEDQRGFTEWVCLTDSKACPRQYDLVVSACHCVSSCTSASLPELFYNCRRRMQQLHSNLPPPTATPAGLKWKWPTWTSSCRSNALPQISEIIFLPSAACFSGKMYWSAWTFCCQKMQRFTSHLIYWSLKLFLPALLQSTQLFTITHVLQGRWLRQTKWQSKHLTVKNHFPTMLCRLAAPCKAETARSRLPFCLRFEKMAHEERQKKGQLEAASKKSDESVKKGAQVSCAIL